MATRTDASSATSTARRKDDAARREETKEIAGTSGEFTLQLSSFQDRAEADQFTEKLRKEGLKPYLLPTRIPGRGVWYRVRLGHYKNWEQAVAAKQGFERKQRLIAYVAKN